MIWATVSSLSHFCWLYRTSPPSAAKNIINLISVLTIWWCPCVVFSCVVGRGCFLWPVCSLGKTLLAFGLLHFILQHQSYLLLQVSLDFLVLHSNPLWWKGHLFSVLVVEGLVGLHRTIELHLLWLYCLGHSLVSLWCWMVCLGNRDHSVIFETAPKYCLSDSFVDHDGYSISSKGFLPAVVDIIVIWVKFIHSSPF